MKSSLTLLLLPILAGGVFATLGGCAGDAGYATSGTVYGDFGYDEPVYYDAPGYIEGGVYAHPPLFHDDHRDEHPADRRAPGPRPAAAPRAPSIPHTPRPAPAPARAAPSGNRDRH